MKILTVTHFYEAHGGGIERVAAQLNREFVAVGHEVLWAASDEDALPANDTAKAIPLTCYNPVERLTGLPMPIPGLAGLARLGQAIRESDAVIVHDALYASSIVAMLLARRAHKPVLLIQHIADIPLANPLLRQVIALGNRIVSRCMLRAADRVVFISATTRQAFSGIKMRHPPLLVFNGVDTRVFSLAPSSERQRLGVPDDARLVLFVGRFVGKKGLTVIERVARARPHWRFVLAGRGPIDPRDWGLPNVIIASGRSGESLAALYRTADMLLLPSVGEGYPLVVQEAMACGLPVVCGADTAEADPGARSWLYGLPVDLRDPDGTAARVLATLDAVNPDPSQRRQMSAYAARAYRWRDSALRIIDALKAV